MAWCKSRGGDKGKSHRRGDHKEEFAKKKGGSGYAGEREAAGQSVNIRREKGLGSFIQSKK